MDIKAIGSQIRHAASWLLVACSLLGNMLAHKEVRHTEDEELLCGKRLNRIL